MRHIFTAHYPVDQIGVFFASTRKLFNLNVFADVQFNCIVVFVWTFYKTNKAI